MSGKRSRDCSRESGGAGKYAKHHHGMRKEHSGHSQSRSQGQLDCVDNFFQSLVACRRSIASLNFKVELPALSPLLPRLVSLGLVLTRLQIDLEQFSEAFRKLQQFCSHDKPSRSNVVRLVMLLDDVYYTLYYCLDVHGRGQTGGGARYSIPPPHVYFISAIYSDEVTGILNTKLKAYLSASLSSRAVEKLVDTWGFPLLQVLDRTQSKNRNHNSSTGTHQLEKRNPLLQVHFSRWRESICLLDEVGLIPDINQLRTLLEMLRPQVLDSPSSATMKGTDPLLPNLLRQYADSCRVWPCHVYAFATPTAAALDKIAHYAPVLEIGAGTGYWSHMLRTYYPNIKIVAYDKDPPMTQGKMIKPNDYHGKSRAWTQVLKGGPEISAQHTNYTLFLCYPPPDNAMALQALRSYSGSTVCYVGEWQGDTGTKAFEKLLTTEFICEESLDLPNWTDTCYTLTVWKRRTSGTSGAKQVLNPAQGVHLLPHRIHPYACSQCGTGRRDRTSDSTSGEVRQLFRCRISYHTYFCSSQCASSGRDLHLAELAVRCVLQQNQNTGENEFDVVREVDGNDRKPLIALEGSYFVKVQAPLLTPI